MNDFEQRYYESEDFWEDSLRDSANVNRIQRTALIVPSDVKSLVDLGCGNGVFLNYLMLQRPELKLTGVDRSQSALKYVQTATTNASIDTLPFEDNSFDCVSCLEVIEHLPIDLYNKAIQEIARVAAKYIIISVPYKENLEESFNKCPQCKSTFSYELHVRSFDDNDMKSLFKSLGYECVSSEYLGATEKLVGHSIYRKLFYSSQFENFVSPICPICGFVNTNRSLGAGEVVKEAKKTNQISFKQKFTSTLTAIPKIFWPKQTKYYWVLCLYKKTV